MTSSAFRHAEARLAFDPAIRVVECPTCEAPIRAPVEGGTTRCAACSTKTEVRARPTSGTPQRPALGPADELARRVRLLAQDLRSTDATTYDEFTPPQGLERLAATLNTPATYSALRREWSAAKAEARAKRLHKPHHPDHPRLCRLAWLALHLARIEHRAHQAERARATLETAIDHAPIDGYRLLLVCELAVQAVRAGDVQSAELWLTECDKAPEVIELDNAVRSARCRLALAKGDYDGALVECGSSTTADLPAPGSGQPAREPHLSDPPAIARAYQRRLAAMRVAAYEALGEPREADKAMACMCPSRWHAPTENAQVDEAYLNWLDEEGLAPLAVQRKRVDVVDKLATERDNLPFFGHALGRALQLLPFFAALGLVVVTMPRCFFDADPFLGAHGYALCPKACDGCTGPLRIFTEWHKDDEGNSTNGPDYYCDHPTLGVAKMTAAQFEAARPNLRGQQLSFAPGAATYLTFLVGFSPLTILYALRARRAAGDRARDLDERIASAAERAKIEVPRVGARTSRSLLRGSLMTLGVGAAAVVVIAIELGLSR